MVDSRCGLHCTGCDFKESCGCGGCIETMGHPFHGKCPIAECCKNKGYVHCGECDIIPCDTLYDYSYLDPEHGDKPQGARVETCRRWAAKSGKKAWENVLLTSAGFEDFEENQKKEIVGHFIRMLKMPVSKAKILFIPTAAIDKEAKEMVKLCRQELIRIGIKEENICTYDMEKYMDEEEAMAHDVIYFTGGDTAHLLRRIKETGFDAIIKKMVYANKVYVGVSAGSIIATPNIGDPFDKETAGLCLIHAYLWVHCQTGTPAKTDLPLPHLTLTDNQAVIVSHNGYQIVEG